MDAEQRVDIPARLEQILGILEEGESVSNALRRLGRKKKEEKKGPQTGRGGSGGGWKAVLARRRAEKRALQEGKSVDEVLGAKAPGEKKEETETDEEDKTKFDALTDASNDLLRSGVTDILPNSLFFLFVSPHLSSNLLSSVFGCVTTLCTALFSWVFLTLFSRIFHLTKEQVEEELQRRKQASAPRKLMWMLRRRKGDRIEGPYPTAQLVAMTNRVCNCLPNYG